MYVCVYVEKPTEIKLRGMMFPFDQQLTAKIHVCVCAYMYLCLHTYTQTHTHIYKPTEIRLRGTILSFDKATEG